MPRNEATRYPYHLAKLVAARLIERRLDPPPDRVLLRLLETMFFASLKTEEGSPARCSVNYVDPGDEDAKTTGGQQARRWSTLPFQQPIPFDERSLTKVAKACDPDVSSLAVFNDEKGELFIWGMVDQELRYADYVSLDSAESPRRPGLFQATITGVGHLSVYKDYTLLGSLEQNMLVEDYHDVLWTGPVHHLLKANLQATLDDSGCSSNGEALVADVAQVESELLIRWQNAVCRTLLSIQQYRHGGGLLIVPRHPALAVHVKYPLAYDRLPRALLGLAQHELLKRQTAEAIAHYCAKHSDEMLPCDHHFNAVDYQKKLESHKQEALGCVHFIASLSRVDGFVLLDRSLTVHGFGVEVRTASDLTDICVAADPQATPHLLKPVSMSQFGTRHRAMMRYCYENEGALGFVISQDGYIRATTKVGDRLVLWENINVQLAFKTENRGGTIKNFIPMIGLFRHWSHALSFSPT